MAYNYLNETGLAYFWGKIKSALSGKQDTVTAGDGIDITNNTISVDSNLTVSGHTAYISYTEPDPYSTYATTSQYGITQLEDSVSSISTATAATPNSVKQAYDKAVTNETLLGSTSISDVGDGTVTGAISALVNNTTVIDVSNLIQNVQSWVEAQHLYCIGGHIYWLTFRITGAMPAQSWVSPFTFANNAGPTVDVALSIAQGNGGNLSKGISGIVHEIRVDMNLESAYASTTNYALASAMWIR